MSTYLVTYSRVGRHGGSMGSPPPAPFTVQATSADDLARQILKDARRYLGSRFPEVVIDLDAMSGYILAGFRTAGEFTLTLPAMDAPAGGAS
ncbi:hypothetical protein [Streptomyces sp. NPDC059076]|uniref:hypothetical protein n=1 Tax=unclassified Streptomyces TaxID=2593676 RepID=UPI0036CED7F6